MKVAVLDITGKETGRKVDLSDDVFGIEPNEHAIYLDVKQYLAHQRQGNHVVDGKEKMVCTINWHTWMNIIYFIKHLNYAVHGKSH